MSLAKPTPGIEETLRALRAGTATARGLTSALLERAGALNPVLNAFVEIWSEAALARADRLDAEGPRHDAALWGIPLAHKDIFARRGRQPSCGVAQAIRGANLPPAPVLDTLANAGAIDLGPLNLAEFALGATGTNAFIGNVGNPWDVGRCSGASSSGSAAAVAAGLAFGSLGTDTGASIRVPASFCGVVGLMPTRGALDTTGCFPLAWSLDTVGVLAGSVADCATLFDVARGVEPAPVADDARLTVGVPDRYYTEGLDPEVAAAWRQAARSLERAGHRILDVPVIEDDEMRSLNRVLMRSEAAAVHQRLLRDQPENYNLAVRKFITGGEGVFAVDYIDAQRLRAPMQRRALATSFAQADVLLTPTVSGLPPAYADIGDPAREEVWRVVTHLARFTQPASYLGLPAMSVPFTLSAGQLPIGLQLIAPPGEERRILSLACALEANWKRVAR